MRGVKEEVALTTTNDILYKLFHGNVYILF